MDLAAHERALRRILWELRPYLDEIVIIGGWVPYLYRRYGGFATWTAGLSGTIEVDVLVTRTLPPGERPIIPEILAGAGFAPEEGPGGRAVWAGSEELGEKIEFLVPHTGTGRDLGRVVPVKEQAGMSAIQLAQLELMQVFSGRLTLPLATDGGEVPLTVRVPLLGAYVVNKAATFMGRRAHEGGGNPKRAKDLLYLRDLMAAGSEVVDRIEADLGRMVAERGTRKTAAEQIRYAGSHLGLALSGSGLPEVARMLTEREPALSPDAALDDVRGHLADLREILKQFSR